MSWNSWRRHSSSPAWTTATLFLSAFPPRHWCHFSARRTLQPGYSAPCWPQVAYHGSPTRFTLATGQVPYHIHDRITDASGSSPAVCNVSAFCPTSSSSTPSALSGDFVLQPTELLSFDEPGLSSDGGPSLFVVQTFGIFFPLRYSYHRLLPCFPAFAIKLNTPISSCF